MKLFKKLAISCLALLAFASFGIATACDDENVSVSSPNPSSESSESLSSSEDSSSSSTEEEVSEFVYRVTVQNATGYGFKNVLISLFDGETEIASKKTNAAGHAVFSEEDVSALGVYTVKTSNLPKGYALSDTNKTYQTLEIKGFESYIQIKPTGVIKETPPIGTDYALGDVMYDFTAKLPDGSYFTLSEELKTKDMVLINFWATWCGPCKSEFPAMNNAYAEYQDKIGLLAVSTTDTMQGVEKFQADNGYLFDMTSNSASGADLTSYFARAISGGIPTSIMVDRFGVIAFMHTGSMTAKSDFTARFDKFCGENYQPTILIGTGEDQVGGNEETNLVKPTVNAPAIEDLDFLVDKGDFKFTWDSEDEYAWPWLITADENEEKYLYAPNASIDYSYATLKATFFAKPGYALYFDYIAQTEDTDILYIVIDGNIAVRLYGTSTEKTWKTCTAYVFKDYEAEGEHELTLIYQKDSGVSVDGETVQIKNLRLEENADNAKGLIFRHAANNRNDAENAETLYKDYANVVYNETDGYYHVNTVNGPILFANLMLASRWSEQSVWNLAYADYLIAEGYNFHADIEDFAWEANQPIPGYLNLTYGYTPVTKELKTLLEYAVASEPVREYGYKFFKGDTHEKEWLEVCAYYEAYDTEQLSDPMKTVTFHAAEQVYVGKNTAVTLFEMTPRGFKYKFIPETSGVYNVYSVGNTDAMCFFVAEDRMTFLNTYTDVLKADGTLDYNFNFHYYMEAGTTYYLLLRNEEMTSFDFYIDRVGDTYSYMEHCAQGPESFNEITYEFYLLDAKPYAYSEEDGYYHLLNKDGSLGEVLYVNMTGATYFPFKDSLSLQKIAADALENYEEENRLFYLNGVDYTNTIRRYAALSLLNDGLYEGYSPLNQELFNILTLLISTKYELVEESWQLFCSYTVTLGSEN